MTSSLGGEHQKPKVSSILLASGGTIKSVSGVATGGGGSSGGFKSATCIGNWFEDRYDSRFADGKTVLPTALEQSWRTTYHGMLGRPGWNGQAAVDRSALSCSTTQKPPAPLGHLVPLDPATQISRQTMDLLVSLEAAVADSPRNRMSGSHVIDTSPLKKSIGSKREVTQKELAEIAAGRKRAFPGHQPERDLPTKDPEGDQQARWSSEQKRRFDDPETRRHQIQTNAVDLFHGKASDKASFVIFKLNVELQQRIPRPDDTTVLAQKNKFSSSSSSSATAAAASFSDNSSSSSSSSAAGNLSASRNSRFSKADRNMSTIPVLSSVKPATTVAFTGTAEVNIISSFSYCGLRRTLNKTANLDGIPTMNLAELKQGLNAYGVTKLTDFEIAVLFKHFDPSGTGQVDLVDFVAGIRGHMNERRKAVVVLAFQLVTSTVRRLHNTDCVRFLDVLSLFDAAQHPDVLSGKNTQDGVLRHIFENYYALATAADRSAMEDTPVTQEMFCDIFEDWSGLVNADFHFESAVRNCFHLTGGEGLSKCTSNIKVEVIHTNGRITQQIIRDDLAVQPTETELITSFLVRQGIKDVKRFKVL